MNIDISLIPTTLDAVHVGLAGLALVLLMILLIVSSGKSKSEAEEPAKAEAPDETSTKAPSLRETSPDSALQLLSLFQQEARLIDFLNENLTGFSDAEVGAAARVVHEGGQKVLAQYFSLAPIREEDEESSITLEEGFNATEIRLTGNVVGQPPFNGVLVHKGWKVTDIRLPKLAEGHDVHVIAPAEVEL